MGETKDKLYIVNISASDGGQPVLETRLVKAKTRTGARAYVANGQISVRVPTQEEVFNLAAKGMKIEVAE
jgi:hypothetical protein